MLKIYQIKDINTSYCFCGWGKQTEHDFNVNDYECVFETKENSTEDLEEIFTIFNYSEYANKERHKEKYKWVRNYKGRSLSVSDIVEIDGRFFYCDTVGWQKLPAIKTSI